MIKLDWEVDFTCQPEVREVNGQQESVFNTDVTRKEFELIVNCIAENDIDNYLEVGVWHGATLYSVVKLFKQNGHTLDAYGYDCFNDGVVGDNSHTSGWPDINMVQSKMNDLPEIKLVIGAAADIDKVITHRKFDFVFHDANHTEDAIIEDLLVLKNVLNANAFVAVHNSAWDEPHRKFFGRTAVDKLIADGHYKYIGHADTAVLLQLV